MGKSAPTPPPAPDPMTIINSSAAANQQTADYQSRLNNSNYNGPEGSVRWSQDPTGQWTQNVSLSAPEQDILNTERNDEYGALNIGANQLQRVSDALGRGLQAPSVQMDVPVDNLQQGYGSGGQIQSGVEISPQYLGYDNGPQIQYGVGQTPVQYGIAPAGPIQSTLGSANLGSAVQDASNAAYSQAASRLDPQWAQAQQQEQAQLAAQGLSPNSAAYQNAMTLFNQAKNDAYNQANFSAVQSGDAEQQALFGETAQQGQFANSAQAQQFAQDQAQQQAYNAASAQQFGQGLQGAAFANTAQQQQNQENAAAAQFYNAGAQDLFDQRLQAGQFANAAQAQQTAQNQALAGFQNTAAQQYFEDQLSNAQLHNAAAGQNFQESAYAQSLPINELTGLLGLGQVAMPQSTQGNTTVAPTNVLGAYQLNNQAALADYAARQQAYSSGLGGLFNLGNAALSVFGM